MLRPNHDFTDTLFPDVTTVNKDKNVFYISTYVLFVWELNCSNDSVTQFLDSISISTLSVTCRNVWIWMQQSSIIEHQLVNGRGLTDSDS